VPDQPRETVPDQPRETVPDQPRETVPDQPRETVPDQPRETVPDQPRETLPRETLRATFDQVAERYDRARPAYPDALYQDLLDVTGLASGDRLLEMGCGTGKATLPLAQRGFRITCVELGASLAAIARDRLAGYGVEVRHGRFEDFAGDGSFALVYAATAWHWIDPAVAYERVWQALRPGGYLAFWNAGHVLPEDGDPFFRQIQPVYDQIGEGVGPDAVWPQPGELPDRAADITESGLFDVAMIRQYSWELTYSAEQYIELLSTFSGHIAMADWQRDRLFGAVRELLGTRRVRRHWGGVLHVARRRGAPAAVG
jgi:SAM-dependent methyltransferase